jgi:hypothetical protein
VLDAHRIAGLDVVDGYLAAGRPVEALQALERLTAVHGPRPDLLARRGLAEIRRGRAEDAARTLQALGKEPLDDPARLYAEINRRLRQQDLAPGERDDLVRMARFVNHRDVEVTGKTKGPGEAILAAEGEHLRLDYRLEEPPPPEPQREPPAFDQANMPRVYYEDDPGLAARDWSPGLQSRTLKTLIDGKHADLLRMYQGEVAGLRPDGLVLGKGGQAVRYRLAGPVLDDPRGVYQPRKAHEPVAREKQAIYLLKRTREGR